MKDEPRLDTLPASVRPIVERCLRRDLRKRWQAIGDVRIALEEGIAATAPATDVLPSRFRVNQHWRGSSQAWPSPPPACSRSLTSAKRHRYTHIVRFQVAPPEKSFITSFAVSPDGRYLAFVDGEGIRELWVRPVDSLDARALPGTDGVSSVPGQIFWSPDSRSIGFVAQQELKKNLCQRRTAAIAC